jgi:DNA-binding CsgD family transcriptional regulator
VQLADTEQRVAVLAAQGRSNREIAATLNMGVSTMEAHLSHIYRKLGVRRVGLAAVLANPSDQAANTMGEARQTKIFAVPSLHVLRRTLRCMVYIVERYLPGLTQSDLLPSK